jgi:L-amino acid N-acyltransferase YncA
MTETSTESTRTYPRRIACGSAQIEVSRMRSIDREALVGFVASLPAEDLLFVPRDITHPKVIDAWMRALDRGDMASLIARDGNTVVGCTAIMTDALGWSRHVGELRVLVSPAGRGKGLGRALIQECFAQAIELGLKKLVAQMTTSQRGAIAIFEDLGFRPEALLHHHVATRDGQMHDLVVLSHDVDAVAARHMLYGLDGAEPA